MLTKRCMQLSLLWVGSFLLIAVLHHKMQFPVSKFDTEKTALYKKLEVNKRYDPSIAACTSQEIQDKDCLSNLSNNTANTVEKFIFFIGYARSGHSIIGSILDAHPNIIISHEYSLFYQWLTMPEQNLNRNHLYSAIYNNSCYNSQKGLRSCNATKKGYSLHVNGLWQGSYSNHITIIGDKSGGMTTKTYKTHQKMIGKAYIKFLQEIKVPVVVIHAIRNPFDNIASMLLYNMNIRKSCHLMKDPYDNEKRLEHQINSYFNQVQTVTEMIDKLNLSVIKIHNDNLIQKPKRVLRKMCRGLDISCSKQYISICSKKVFKSSSHSRYLVKWTTKLIDKVQRRIDSYTFLKKYSFFDS